MSLARRTRAAASALLLSHRPQHWEALSARLVEAGVSLQVHERVETALAAADRGVGALLVDLGHSEVVGRPFASFVERVRAKSAAALVGLSCGRAERDALDLQEIFAAGALDFIALHEAPEVSVQRVRAVLASIGEGASAQISELVDAQELSAALVDASERALSAKTSLALLCFDLEPVRQMAGTLSEAHAEEWIAALGERLRDSCRRDDYLSRVARAERGRGVRRTSRGEFMLLLRGRFDATALLSIARRQAEALRRPLEVAGERLSASFHVGAALWDATSAPSELAEQARAAACWARRRGACAVELFTPELKVRALERLSLESALRRALENQEFTLHYQPRVAVDSGRTVAVEALVRWEHPQLGLVSPADFIPLAEETGLIAPLGQWVLHEACAQARRWQDAGLAPVRMAVNVSPIQFRDPRLVWSVERVLRRTGLDPRWLELELTESSLMDDVETVVATLERFKRLGISISVDDFGTGYSSLSYLRRFPIDSLKIDRSFLREVTRDPDDASIATAIVLMAKCLRLRVVGEGVETPGQLAFLRIMKCDEAQGFHFSRPLPAKEVLRFLEPARASESTASQTAA